MKEYIIDGNSNSFDIVHLLGNKDDYVITEDAGSLIYESSITDRRYIISSVETVGFKAPNTNGDSKFIWSADYVNYVIDGGGWTQFASNSYNLVGAAASVGTVTSGTINFDLVSEGAIDITNETWTDLMAVQIDADGKILRWIAYKNITNVNIIKAEWQDFAGEISPATAQSVFGHADILAFDGITTKSFVTEDAVVEIHHGSWDANSASNWILSEKARTAGNGLVNNWSITSHGRAISIDSIKYTDATGSALFYR